MIIPSRRRFLLGAVGLLTAPAIVRAASLMPISVPRLQLIEEGIPYFEPPWFDVTDFGADPTGRTDSTEAFRLTIEAASRNDGVVFCPPGTFVTSNVDVLFGGHVNVVGAGADKTTVRFR